MNLGRRSLLRASLGAAGTVVFDFAWPSLATAATSADSAGKTTEVTAWLCIHPNDRVVLRIPQTELGQGVVTTLSQIFMEELGLGWTDFETEFFDPEINRTRDNVYVHTSTLASWSAEWLFKPMRTAGAQVRTLLFSAAGKSLGVSAESLQWQGCRLWHQASGESVGVSAVALAAAALPVPAPDAVKLKAADQWTLIGQPMPRRDSAEKAAGRAQYGIDVRLPGMKFAAVRQCPVFGGRLHRIDPAPALAMAGVHAVIPIQAGPTGYTVPETLWDTIDWGMDDAIAVVADNTWLAQRALDALKPEWDEGPYAGVDSAAIEASLVAALETPGRVMRQQGQSGDVVARSVEAEYHYPYMDHAPMEPMNCTARVTDDGVEVWAGSQYAMEAQRIAAYAAQVPLQRSRFHLMLAGGGFGRRLSQDFVSQAVQIARVMKGTPIKLTNSREENLRRGYYAPVGKARFKGALDATGRVVQWHSKAAFGRAPVQPYAISRVPYAVPDLRCEYAGVDTPAPFGWMRGVGLTQGAWMNHLFVAELAEAAGRPVLDLMEALLEPDALPSDIPEREAERARVARQRDLLRAAIAHGGAPGTLGPSRGRGFAVTDMSYLPGDAPSCVAMTMDVALDERSWPRVERVVVVVDCGTVINPSVVKAQVEGGVIFGLSNALYAEITLEKGRVMQQNFNDYPLLRLPEAPVIEVFLQPSTRAPSGIGEGMVPTVIAALVMSIRAAGGPFIRRLPVASALRSET